MVLDLTTNEHQPLLGMVRAILGVREVGLETEDFILVFAAHEIDTLLCLGLHTGNASVSLYLAELLESVPAMPRYRPVLPSPSWQNPSAHRSAASAPAAANCPRYHSLAHYLLS